MLRRKSGLSKQVGLIVIVVLALLALTLAYPYRINNDSSLYLYAGEKLLDGELPYVDFYEINLPVIYFLSTPPVLLSRLSGVHPITVANALMTFVVAYSLWMSWQLIARSSLDARIRMRLTLVLIVGIAISTLQTFTFPTFGQREHIFFLLFIPYIILRWLRTESETLVGPLPFVTGMLAAVGTSIKPHFLAVAVVVEVYVLLRRRTLRTFLVPEVFGALVTSLVFLLYLLFHLEVAQGYVNKVLPAVLEAYDAYGRLSYEELLRENSQVLLYVSFAGAVWLMPRIFVFRNVLRLMSLVVLAGVLIFILQNRGWIYHRLIADAAFVLLVFVWVTDVLWHAIPRGRWYDTWNRRGSRVARAILATAFMVSSTIGLVTMMEQPEIAGVSELAGLYERHSEPGDYVLAIDWHGLPQYPALHVAELRYASRYLPAYPTLMGFHHSTPDEVLRPGYQPVRFFRDYLEDTVEDIERFRPSLLVVRRFAFSRFGRVDIRSFLVAQGFFENPALRNYVWAEDMPDITVYVRSGE